MPGNSKLLTLAAVGVIGVGAAMPYWSRSELSSPLPATSGQGAATSRINAFIGQQQQPAQPDFVMPEIRKAVSLSGTQAGLDAAVPEAPSLNDEYPVSISPTAARQQLVDLSPQGYQRVSVARHEPARGSVESFAIPIDMPPREDDKASQPRYVEKPPVVQSEPQPQQPAAGRWQPQPTSIVVNKPIMSEPQVRSVPPQQVYVPPVQPQPTRSFAAAQPRQRHRLVDGDTLPKLAERYLGRADLDWAIFEANRDVLNDPQLLPLRVEISIPSPSELNSLPQGGSVTPSAPSAVTSSASTMQPLQPLRPLGSQPHLRMTPLGSR